MNSNNKLSLEMIQDDLEGLSKKLYLESPDLWMDFLDKTGNNKFDFSLVADNSCIFSKFS